MKRFDTSAVMSSIAPEPMLSEKDILGRYASLTVTDITHDPQPPDIITAPHLILSPLRLTPGVTQ